MFFSHCLRIAFCFLLFGPLAAQDQESPLALHNRGVTKFFKGDLKGAVADWDKEIALLPHRGPHHWQRGLALYYLGEYEKGIAQFESHQTVNGHDVENAAWHFICVARTKGGSVEKARKKFIPIEGDTRVPMKEIHLLFAGKGSEQEVLDAAKDAPPGDVLRNQLCYAHLYLGLYYEALGEVEKSKKHLKLSAVDYRMNHYMGMVAQLHHRLVSGEGKRPNFIFLFADDQRADTIGAHGNPHIITPNLDRLAEQGFSFRENYCAGSFSGAVCVASRAMLMTGKQWMQLPKKPGSNWGDAIILPSELEKRGGYQSFIIGKWHNGAKTLQQSFTAGRSVYLGGMVDHTTFEVQDLEEGKLSEKRDAGGFSSEVFADEAVTFIEEADGEKPFFLYVSLMAPHDTRNPPMKYREIYYAKRPPLPENFLPQHPFRTPTTMGGRDESLAPWPRTKKVISDQLCEYYGLITHLDEQVGKVMKALEKSPHAENTYLIYTADHGLGMGSHGLLGKQNVYEQSMKAPLIIAGPGVPAGKSSHGFNYVHDLTATIYGLAGLPQPGGMDSRDLTPVIKGEKEAVRDHVFLPFQDHSRAVRVGHWKLHQYPRINHTLLFDLEKDPHEMKNLADDPAHAGQLKKMRAALEEARKDYGDQQPLTVQNPEPKEAVYDNAKRTLDVWQPKWIRDKYFGGRSRTDHGPGAGKKK
ncbi:MAG: sulfatase-like hydrolase/transferase [Akkermansiaceae bacterium]